MGGYGCFAAVYDRLTENIDYDEMCAYYDRMITKLGGKKGILLELGCGTGNVSMGMARLGYDVIGTDLSVDMLNIAMSKPHDGIEYLCQDMRTLDMYGTNDVTICTLDGINHLDGEQDILDCFNSVSLFLEPGGLFLFDVNTVRKHREILSDNTFVYDLDDVYCVWQNFYDNETDRVDFVLDIFTEENGLYLRQTEEFSETALPLGRIKELLLQAGFESVEIHEFMTENKGGEECEKVLFSAVNKGKQKV
ncbi:MAG: class I SAM-dependent methyltransferase [Eubacterium sp.]|nr:class I SAM-dependent methyltransferase [Eubacterium sp.]